MKNFKLFLLLAWLNIKIIYKNLKEAIKNAVPRIKEAHSLIFIIPAVEKIKDPGLFKLHFCAEVINIIVTALGAGCIIYSFYLLSKGKKIKFVALLVLGLFLLMITFAAFYVLSISI
jgi:hypothetical protein